MSLYWRARRLMRRPGWGRTILTSAIAALLAATAVAWAARTDNFLGTIFIADPSTQTRLMAVNSDGSINVDITSGSVTCSGCTFTVGAATSGGATPYHLSGGTAAGTNSTSVKNSAGNLYRLTPINPTTTIAYLKIYDSSSAPTCSSATNLKHVYPIPPAAASGQAGGFVAPDPVGESYANGIGYCVTGGGGDTDNTNAPAGVYIEGSYK